jgi:diketogulonate reductase-like aldo/keto reductase
LTRTAIAAGFRGVDTANQRRHYFEAGVGQALGEALSQGLAREDLFAQTKFTHVRGQDHRLPYDKNAPLAKQVEHSFASSLDHLGLEYVDSYVLHGPSTGDGLTPADLETWSAMERLQRAGRTRLLGVSNVTLDQLAELYARADVKPALVQNRCYASMGWDREVRAFCRERRVLYQGFSLLTANREVLRHPVTHRIAARTERTPAQVVFRFALQAGMVALTGTTSAAHMRDDLDVYAFALHADEVAAIEHLMA